MTDLLTDLITDLIGGVDGAINSAFNSLMDTCFNAEYALTHTLGVQVISLDNLKLLIFMKIQIFWLHPVRRLNML